MKSSLIHLFDVLAAPNPLSSAGSAGQPGKAAPGLFPQSSPHALSWAGLDSLLHVLFQAPAHSAKFPCPKVSSQLREERPESYASFERVYSRRCRLREGHSFFLKTEKKFSRVSASPSVPDWGEERHSGNHRPLPTPGLRTATRGY